jgi:hypothetical protein
MVQKYKKFREFQHNLTLYYFQEFNESQKLINYSLKLLNKSALNETSFEEGISLLDSITAFEDLFNVTTMKASLDLVQTVTESVKDYNNVISLASVLSNIIEIMKSQREFLTTEETTEVKGKFETLLESILDAVATNLDESSMKELKLDFKNIKGKLSSLSIISKNNQIGRTSFNSGLNTSLSLPSSVAKTLNYFADELYTQLIVWPSEIFSKGVEDKDSKFFTDVISFEIKQKKESKEFPIEGLQDNITIEIPKILPVSSLNEGKYSNQVYICKYFNRTQNKWVTDGVTFVKEENRSLFCNTSHLSLFSVLLTSNQTIIETLLPGLFGRGEDQDSEAFTERIIPLIYYLIIWVLLMLVYLISKAAGSKNQMTTSQPEEPQFVGSPVKVIGKAHETDYVKPIEQQSPDKEQGLNTNSIFELGDTNVRMKSPESHQKTSS